MRNHLSRLFFLFVSLPLIVVSLSFLGCSGDAGPEGPQGPAGADGGDGGDGVLPAGAINLADSDSIAEMVATKNVILASIDSITISSPPVVDFSLTDKDGLPLVGLSVDSISLTLAKLVPEDAGTNTPSRWVSYINQIEEADGSTDPGSEEQDVALQASRDSGGTLVDNMDGTYAYTFANDVTAITDPVAIAWKPGFTHRVGFEVRIADEINPDNPTLTFVPNGDDVTETKAIVALNTCNNCHVRLSLHGGGRFTTDYCVTCHNTRTRDQDTGALLDMAHMAHAIHSPDTRGSEDYTVYGFFEGFHDYSEVTFPMSNVFCENCHTNSEDTPDGDAWKTTVTAEACGGCHAEGLGFTTPDATSGLSSYEYSHADLGGATFQNSSCLTCHFVGTGVTDGNGDTVDIETAHYKGAKLAKMLGEDFEFEIMDVTQTGAGESPQVQFRIKKPSDDTYYDVLSALEFVDDDTDDDASFNIYFAWGDGIDYDNNGNGGDWGEPIRFRLSDIQTAATSAQDVDGSHTFDSGNGALGSPLTLPAFTGLFSVGMGGHPVADRGDGTYVEVHTKSAIYKVDTDPDPDVDNSRRDVVDIANCNTCHVQLALHGGNRTDEPQQCIVCHNADATDAGDRPGDWLDPAGAVDGRGEEGVHFGYMVHKIHAANGAFYGRSLFDASHVTYPAPLNDCTKCHIDGTYYAAAEGARPVSVGTGDDPVDDADDEAITPNTAMCSACHSGDAAIAHMELNGGVFVDGDPYTSDTGVPATATEAEGGRPLKANLEFGIGESCATCHKEGGLVDVAVAHEID